MSQSTTLKDIDRSMKLGFLADEMLGVLEQRPEAFSGDQKSVLQRAKSFLESAEKGYGIVEEAQPLTGGIAAAVNLSRSYREAEETLAIIDKDEEDELQEFLQKLIGDVDALLSGEDVDDRDFRMLFAFFDALARTTLSSTSRSLEEYANQRYEPRMHAR